MKRIKKTKRLTNQEKWMATVACDCGYDGRFVYGVKTTGIFCRPSCRSKTPLQQNVQFFADADEAVRAGFRPCRKCRPDLVEFQPQREQMDAVKQAYARYFNDPERLAEEINRLGIHANHLIRLFRRFEHCTPGNYLTRLRVERAEHLLREGTLNILETSLECGFGSVSNFYKQFKLRTGTTPGQVRWKPRAGR